MIVMIQITFLIWKMGFVLPTIILLRHDDNSLDLQIFKNASSAHFWQPFGDWQLHLVSRLTAFPNLLCDETGWLHLGILTSIIKTVEWSWWLKASIYMIFRTTIYVQRSLKIILRFSFWLETDFYKNNAFDWRKWPSRWDRTLWRIR